MARHHYWFERETTLRGRWGEPDDMFAPEVRRALRTQQPSPPRLPGAMMAGLYLRQRDLSGADFSAADLSGADLGLVQLVGADLRGARVWRETLRNPRAVDLSGALTEGAELHKPFVRGVAVRVVDAVMGAIWFVGGVVVFVVLVYVLFVLIPTFLIGLSR